LKTDAPDDRATGIATDETGVPPAVPRPTSAARRAAAWIVGFAAAASSAVILHAARGTNFYVDEWWFITRRRDASFDDFMRPNVDHLVAIPVAIYKFLFVTFGLRSYWPYLVVLVGLHVITGLLLYLYLKRRAPIVYAVVATVVLLFLGYAWQDLVWAFSITYLFSTATGVATLLFLDRGDRAGDIGAAIALTASIASGGIGLVFAAGALVELAWTRASWRRLWVPLAPLALYGLWYVGWGDSKGQLANLSHAPTFITDAAGNAAGALFGASVGPGRVLAACVAIVIIVSVVRAWPISPRFANTLAMLGGFWLLLVYSRGSGVYGSPTESRYIYIGALLLLLVGAEVLGTWKVPRRFPTWVTVVGSVALLALLGHTIAGNLDALDKGAAGLRQAATIDKARYSALVLARRHADRNVVLTFTGIRAGELLPAIQELDYPVFTHAELLARPEWQRVWADNTLLAVLGNHVHDDDGSRPVADELRVATLTGGQLARAGGCGTVTPTAPTASVQFQGDEVALSIAALGDAPVDVTARSVADEFHAPPFARVMPGTTKVLDLRPSHIEPWTVQLSSAGPMRVCGLG
jgi:hypothetical protein